MPVAPNCGLVVVAERDILGLETTKIFKFAIGGPDMVMVSFATGSR